MRKKGFVFVFVIMLCMILCPVAMADIVGSWGVGGQMKMKIAIKGYGSDTINDYVEDLFEFGAENSFSTLDYNQATWGYNKKKVIVNIDPGELAHFFESELENMIYDETGYTADVYDISIATNTLNMAEKKNDIIKGKWTLVFTCMINVNGLATLPVKVNVKYTFSGTRSSTSTTVTIQRKLSESENSGNSMTEAINYIIMDRVAEILSTE
jgi:hypothetical protein